MVDFARMAVYGIGIARRDEAVDGSRVPAACTAAFAGALLGTKLLRKATLRTVRAVVSAWRAGAAAGRIAGGI